MTRIFTDGAEAGDTLFWSLVGANVSSQTSVARIGGRSYQVGAVAAATSARKDITPIAEFYARFAIQYNSVNQIPEFTWSSAAGTVLGRWRINTSQVIECYTGTGTLVHTGSTVMQVNTWYIIELHVKIADAGGVIEYKIDGVLVSAFSGDTKPGSDTTVGQILLQKMGSFSTVGYWDDLALNDVAGGVDDSWCGDGHIYGLVPNADGDSSQWLGSDGNSTNNYLLVDEIPHNTDTDYVSSATSADKDLYNVASIPTLPSNSVVKRVQVQARAREITADADSINLGVKSGSTEGWSGNIVVGTTYAAKSADFTTNPATSAAWTESEINSMQIGVKLP